MSLNPRTPVGERQQQRNNVINISTTNATTNPINTVGKRPGRSTCFLEFNNKNATKSLHTGGGAPTTTQQQRNNNPTTTQQQNPQTRSGTVMFECFLLASSGVIWRHMSSGVIWRHLASSGVIWPHLASSGLIWLHLAPLIWGGQISRKIRWSQTSPFLYVK